MKKDDELGPISDMLRMLEEEQERLDRLVKEMTEFEHVYGMMGGGDGASQQPFKKFEPSRVPDTLREWVERG